MGTDAKHVSCSVGDVSHVASASVLKDRGQDLASDAVSFAARIASVILMQALSVKMASVILERGPKHISSAR